MCYELKTKKVTKSNTYLVCGSRWCINNKSIDIPNIGKYCQISDGAFAGNIDDILEIREDERIPSYKGGIAYCLAVKRGAVFRNFSDMKISIFVLVWYMKMVNVQTIVHGLNPQRLAGQLASYDDIYNSTGCYVFGRGITQL
ncbi:hypothetical protein [Pectinatus frisingensis]|uniref:hypothetical protein n=1 Tax=Pectinatus frisingensis TaxID=865 RepID=UPI0015F76140|nr:hypothetical protein [Pectinatus frisingensis]